jgi:carbon storage regulator
MLVLKRHAGQSFVIGDSIEIQVLDLSCNRVKLGIQAPDNVSVVRKEVLLTRQQNLRASKTVSRRVLDWISRGVAVNVTPAAVGQNLDGPSVLTEPSIRKFLR